MKNQQFDTLMDARISLKRAKYLMDEVIKYTRHDDYDSVAALNDLKNRSYSEYSKSGQAAITVLHEMDRLGALGDMLEDHIHAALKAIESAAQA